MGSKLSFNMFTVSIGRRLQNPLAEMTKVEPKHLGVGMYQVTIYVFKYYNVNTSTHHLV